MSSYSARVDPDAVYAFARATNDANPRYVSCDAVPSLFTNSLIFEAWASINRELLEEARISGFVTGVHGEHDVFYRAPIHPGMGLCWRTEPYAARQTNGGALSTIRVTIADEAGTPRVEHLWSSFFVKGTVVAPFGPDLPDHTFPEEARCHPVGRRALPVDRDQAFRYAGVTGDRVGHALDDEVARRSGFPAKILQGMCTLSMSSGALVDMLAGGDPAVLRRLACRFTAPARPGTELSVEVFDAGLTSEGGRAFAFEVTQETATVIKHGRVELAPE
jgi:acyl dehydratase